jgi:hypothetical protein
VKELARSGSLVVMLLMSVGTASAECAWVLWIEGTVWSTVSQKVTKWDLVGAMPTNPECEEAAQNKIESLHAHMSNDKVPGN